MVKIAGRLLASSLLARVLLTIGMLLLAPLTLLPLWLLGVEQFSPLVYALFKGLWAGAIAALLAVPMILLALNK